MIITEEYLKMQYISIALELNIFQKNLKKNIKNQNIITNICRIQAFDAIMYWYICIEFIDFMMKGKILLNYTNLFSTFDYEKNDTIKLKYFQ